MTYVFLSHVLTADTPTYGQKSKVELVAHNQMCKGDLTNQTRLVIPNHAGSHVDAAKHFFDDGMMLTDFRAEDFVYAKVELLSLPLKQGRLLTSADFGSVAKKSDTELLLIKTNFEERRYDREYIYDNPGFDATVAEYILQTWPKLRAIGFDFISVNRFPEADAGIAAHRVFLKRPRFLIYEDLSLQALQAAPKQVVALPLRFTNGDGGPITMIANLS